MPRERPTIAGDASLSGQRVGAVLKRLGGPHGRPNSLLVAPGPACTSTARDAGAHQHGGKRACSRPGRPPDQPCMAAFQAWFREACLHQHGLGSREAARTAIAAWRGDDQTERPHTALHGQAPAVDTATWLQRQGMRTASDEPATWTNVWGRTTTGDACVSSWGNCCRCYLLRQGQYCASCPLISQEERLQPRQQWMKTLLASH